MLGGSEGLIVVVLILVLFGGSQIPKLARNLGLAQKELKNALQESQAESESDNDKPAARTATSGAASSRRIA